MRVDNKIETPKANQALRDYAMMGPGRSLRLLWKWYRGEYEEGTPLDDLEPYEGIPPTKRLTTLGNWSARFQWMNRIADWDRLRADRLQMLWEERALQVRSFDWDIAQNLRRHVTNFLELMQDFTTRSEGFTTDPDTGEKIKVITLGLNFSFIELARVIKIASELQRLATDQPTAIDAYQGAALDALIEAALDERARLEDPTYGGQAGDAGPLDGHQPDPPPETHQGGGLAGDN